MESHFINTSVEIFEFIVIVDIDPGLLHSYIFSNIGIFDLVRLCLIRCLDRF